MWHDLDHLKLCANQTWSSHAYDTFYLMDVLVPWICEVTVTIELFHLIFFFKFRLRLWFKLHSDWNQNINI